VCVCEFQLSLCVCFVKFFPFGVKFRYLGFLHSQCVCVCVCVFYMFLVVLHLVCVRAHLLYCVCVSSVVVCVYACRYILSIWSKTSRE